MRAQLAAFEHELQGDPALTEGVLRELPPALAEMEGLIRCSPENLERAVCRAFARCREWGEFWKVEVVKR